MKLGDLYALMRKGPLGPLDYTIAFPQANTVKTIWGIIDLVASGVGTTNELHSAISSDAAMRMSDRQVRYYADAARYLGMLDKSGTNYILTDIGRLFSTSDSQTRTTIFISQLSGMRSVFDLTLEYLLHNRFPDQESLQKAMTADDVMGKNDSEGDTVVRRAECLEAWLQWLTAQVD